MPPRRDAVRVVQHRADDEEEEDDASSADDEEEGEEEDEEEEEAVPAGPGATGVRARERTEGCPLVPAGGPAPKKIKLVGGLAAARAAGGCKARAFGLQAPHESRFGWGGSARRTLHPRSADTRHRLRLGLRLDESRGRVRRLGLCVAQSSRLPTPRTLRAAHPPPPDVDCPDKPCYLCKKVGHTTATCPHRAAVAGTAGGGGGGGGGEGAPRARRALATPLRLAWRETGGCVAGAPEGCGGGCGSPAAPYAPPRDWRVCSAVTRLHARRVTALAWHPTRRSLLVSGDKRGQVAFWDHESMEKAVLPSGAAHHWLVTAVRFLDGDPDTAYTSGVDGRVSATNCETHAVQRVGTLNPGMAWTEDENKLWRSATAMEALQGAGALLVGDDVGRVTLLDPRTGRMGASFQARLLRGSRSYVSPPHEVA